MKLYRQVPVVDKTQSHLVWVSRYWRTILKAGVATYFEKVVLEVSTYDPNWHIKEVGIAQDHVHLHMIIF